MNSTSSSTKSAHKIAVCKAENSGAIRCLSISPNTKNLFAIGGESKKIELWSLSHPYEPELCDKIQNRNQAIGRIGGSQSSIVSLAFNNDESQLLSGSNGGSVKIYDLNQDVHAGKFAYSLNGHLSTIHSVCYHPYSDYIIGSCSEDTNVRIWDSRTKSSIVLYKGHKSGVNCTKFAPNGQCIASSSSDGTVHIFDLVAGKRKQSFQISTPESGSIPMSIEFNENQNILSCTCKDSTVNIFDLEQKEETISTPKDSSRVYGVSFENGKSSSNLYSISSYGIKSWTFHPRFILYDSLQVSWGGNVGDFLWKSNQEDNNDLLVGSFRNDEVYIWDVNLHEMNTPKAHETDCRGQSTRKEKVVQMSSNSRKESEYSRCNTLHINLPYSSSIIQGDKPCEMHDNQASKSFLTIKKVDSKPKDKKKENGHKKKTLQSKVEIKDDLYNDFDNKENHPKVLYSIKETDFSELEKVLKESIQIQNRYRWKIQTIQSLRYLWSSSQVNGCIALAYSIPFFLPHKQFEISNRGIQNIDENYYSCLCSSKNNISALSEISVVSDFLRAIDLKCKAHLTLSNACNLLPILLKSILYFSDAGAKDNGGTNFNRDYIDLDLNYIMKPIVNIISYFFESFGEYIDATINASGICDREKSKKNHNSVDLARDDRLKKCIFCHHIFEKLRFLFNKKGWELK